VLARCVDLRLKCALLRFTLFSRSLYDVLGFALLERLLSVPKRGELSVFWRLGLGRKRRLRPFIGRRRGLPVDLRPCSCRTSASLSYLGSCLLITLDLPVNRLLVESLVTADIFFFLRILSTDLRTLPANTWLEPVPNVLIWLLLARGQLFLQLFDRLHIKRILLALGDHLGLLGFVKNLFTFCVRLWFELTLLRDQPLDFSLFEFDELLFALEVFRHTSLPRFQSYTHLFGLSAHGLGLKRAPRCLFHDPLFLLLNDSLAWLFRLPQVALVVISRS